MKQDPKNKPTPKTKRGKLAVVGLDPVKTDAPAIAQIYALACPFKGDVRYIGKANNAKQRLKNHLKENRRRTPVYDWIASLREKGAEPRMHVLVECRREEWESEEIRLIAEYRASGARLLNVADGGNAPKCPDEVLSRNGHDLNKRLTNPEGELYGYWVASRVLGKAISDAKKAGRPFTKLMFAKETIQSLDEQGRIRFSKRYLERHPDNVKQTWENREA